MLVGKGLGHHKIAPNLSPGKTVEGSLAGIVGAIIASTIFSIWYAIPYHFLVGFGIGVAALIGDLIESSFKRELGIKDFGSIFVGHGGILDRFDSVLAVSTFFYFILKLEGIA